MIEVNRTVNATSVTVIDIKISWNFRWITVWMAQFVAVISFRILLRRGNKAFMVLRADNSSLLSLKRREWFRSNELITLIASVKWIALRYRIIQFANSPVKTQTTMNLVRAFSRCNSNPFYELFRFSLCFHGIFSTLTISKWTDWRQR